MFRIQVTERASCNRALRGEAAAERVVPASGLGTHWKSTVSSSQCLGRTPCPLAFHGIWALLTCNCPSSFPGSALHLRGCVSQAPVSAGFCLGVHHRKAQAGDFRVGRKEEAGYFPLSYSDLGVSLTVLDFLVATVSPGQG